MVDAGDGRADGAGAGGQDQLVVALHEGTPADTVQDLDPFALAVDALDLVLGSHVEVEADAQVLGGDDEQVLAVLDVTADVIRQAAVGKGHVAVLFKDDDFGALAQATGPGGGRHAGGDATDDDDFHGCTSCLQLGRLYHIGGWLQSEM